MPSPTLVQSRSVQGVSPLSLAFNNPTVSGNAIYVLVGDGIPTDTFQVTDSQGNTYAAQAQIVVPASSAWQIFRLFNIPGGGVTITFTPTTGGTAASLAIHELSGVTVADTQQASANGVGNSQDSGPLTPAFTLELLFGFAAGISSASLISFTPGAGWTQAEVNLLGGAGALPFLTQWQVVAAKSPVDSTSTTAVSKGGSFTWASGITGTFSIPPFVEDPTLKQISATTLPSFSRRKR